METILAPDKQMGRPDADLPIDSEDSLYDLPVKEGIQILILYLEREVVRR